MNSDVYDKLYSLIVGKHREHHNTIYMSQFEKECVIEPDQANMITNDLLQHNVWIYPLKIGDKIYVIDNKEDIIKELEIYEVGLTYFFTNPTLTEVFRYSDKSKLWFNNINEAEHVLNTLKTVKADINEAIKPIFEKEEK